MPSVVDSGRALSFSSQTVEEKAVIGIAIKDHTPYQIEKVTESYFVLTDPNSNFAPLEVPENIDFLDKGLEGIYVDPLLGYGHSAFQDASAMINQVNDILMDSRVMHNLYNSSDAWENGGVTHSHYGNTETYLYMDEDGNLERTIEIAENGDGTRTKVTTEHQGWLNAGTTTTETQVQTEDGSWETIDEEDDGFFSWVASWFDCFPAPPPPHHFDSNGEGQEGMILAEMQEVTPIESIKFNLV